MASFQRACVNCKNLLPSASKMSRLAVPSDEAASKQWLGDSDDDGTVIVDMCLQCQIERSERERAAR
jgi:RNA polymerase subunit RPABC4/transcription elongation factor Spt4